MHCPFCHFEDTRVADTRPSDDGQAIRRRRVCPRCERRFSTLETAGIAVIKRSGATEPFSRAKIVSGVRKACKGRPVSEDDLALLAQQVEETVRSWGVGHVDADKIGTAILEPLRDLDQIAYLRFASVYSGFDTLDDFEGTIRELQEANAQRSARANSLAESGDLEG